MQCLLIFKVLGTLPVRKWRITILSWCGINQSKSVFQSFSEIESPWIIFHRSSKDWTLSDEKSLREMKNDFFFRLANLNFFLWSWLFKSVCAFLLHCNLNIALFVLEEVKNCYCIKWLMNECVFFTEQFSLSAILFWRYLENTAL